MCSWMQVFYSLWELQCGTELNWTGWGCSSTRPTRGWRRWRRTGTGRWRRSSRRRDTTQIHLRQSLPHSTRKNCNFWWCILRIMSLKNRELVLMFRYCEQCQILCGKIKEKILFNRKLWLWKKKHTGMLKNILGSGSIKIKTLDQDP